MIHKSVRSGKSFTISKMEQDYCERYEIPFPVLTPFERLQQVLSFRNRLHLYNTTCDMSGDKIISCVPPESGLKVYDIDLWQSDQWDARNFGRNYDFSRSFFEQFAELRKLVPTYNLSTVRASTENCDYVSGVSAAKNCYLIFQSIGAEDCMYSNCIQRSKSIFSSIYVLDSEICYDCTDISNCYCLKYSEHCTSCRDSSFLFNCQSCNNCYGCANLSHKQYHIFNKAYSKAEYEVKIAGFDLGSHQFVEKQRIEFNRSLNKFPIKYYFGMQNEIFSGNYLQNTKNCNNCFFVNNAEDCEHSLYISDSKNSILHAMYGRGSELIYNCVTAGSDVYNQKFCVGCWSNARDLEYCIDCCLGTSNCFGSVGLNRASYCILNKQYNKQDYFDLVTRIKNQMKVSGEYGLFFPEHISPFYYNQSTAQDFFPLEKESIITAGFKWKDESVQKTSDSQALPDNIAEATDNLIGQTFSCELTGKAFKILKNELAFYRKNKIPLPHKHPIERLKQQLSFFELKELKTVYCDSCSSSLETSLYESQHPVLCDSCYQKEIYG